MSPTCRTHSYLDGDLKSDRIVLLVMAVVIVGIISKVGLDAKTSLDRAALARQQHEAMHSANEARRKRLAYDAHLKRAAYDAAHPEEVARRKAVAAEARRVAEAERVAARAKAREAARIAEVAAHERAARENRENHPCETANSLEVEAARYVNAGRMRATYDAAVSGLHYAERCDDSAVKMVDEGYLLSFKAHAEHDLGTGDWRTDYNQANALLVQCQTTPGLYGTKTGAQCETQEHYNISRTTNWDLEQ
jgi:hypothetical protein